MSEEMKRGIRNANIGLAVAAAVLTVGFIFLHGNDGAMELLALGVFAVGMGVSILLDRRDERARARRTRRSS